MMHNLNILPEARFEGKSIRKVVVFLVLICLFACGAIEPAGAMLNCFNPNMFKMNKGSMNQPYGAERANWYPQSPYQPNYYGQASVGPNPMKLFFQPKWRGASLFGSKGWNSWKVGANSNFYRPGYGYGASIPGNPSTGGFQFSDHLNVAPLAMSPLQNSYSSSNNDGWSAPVYSPSPIQQTQLNNYDTYIQHPTHQPLKQQLAPLVDPYSVKSFVNGNKYTGTTTKNIMQATGYNLYDEPVAIPNRTYGYSYPDWYSGVESPSKIAQQLMKYGLKKKQHQNRSAPLIQGSLDLLPPGTSDSKFTILDEPRFVGYGTIDTLSNKEARLSCSFSEAIDQANRPLWVKFLGTYNSSKIIDPKVVPPFNCASSQCRTQEIESTKDYRYSFDNGPATSTLIIAEPRLSDHGTYRCSALTKAINNNPLETIYQIIQLGII